MEDTAEETAALLATIRTESGRSLLELASASPVLLVFLRHFGCSFCRKAISDVAELRGGVGEARSSRRCLCTWGPPELAKVYFEYYGIGDVERINDPEAAIYRNPVFQLSRQSVWLQVLTPKVVIGWLKGAIFKHGIGKIEGDGSQMPGIFFLKGATIVRRFIYKTIADEPNYLKLVG